MAVTRSLAIALVIVCVGLAAGFGAGALWLAGPRFLLPLAFVAPLVVLALRADFQRSVRSLPVELRVFGFNLPDANSLPAMVYYEPSQPVLYQGRNLDPAYHRFAHRQPVLGPAKTQHIHAGPPGDVGDQGRPVSRIPAAAV